VAGRHCVWPNAPEPAPSPPKLVPKPDGAEAAPKPANNTISCYTLSTHVYIASVKNILDTLLTVPNSHIQHHLFSCGNKRCSGLYSRIDCHSNFSHIHCTFTHASSSHSLSSFHHPLVICPSLQVKYSAIPQIFNYSTTPSHHRLQILTDTDFLLIIF